MKSSSFQVLAVRAPGDAAPAARGGAWRLTVRMLLAACLAGSLAGMAGARARAAPAPGALHDRATDGPRETVSPGSAEAPRRVERDSPQDNGRGRWRNLTRAQRDAIRRLSQEERDALARGTNPRQGGAAPGARLSPEERQQLRDQIREEHERHGARHGAGKRF